MRSHYFCLFEIIYARHSVLLGFSYLIPCDRLTRKAVNLYSIVVIFYKRSRTVQCIVHVKVVA